MNVDFANDPGFSAYVLLLMFSGIVMVVLATPKVRSSIFLRILNVVLGLGFFGYGFYLAFLFNGGTYFMFFKAFIVPVVLAFRTIQASRANRRIAAARATAVPPAFPPAEYHPGYNAEYRAEYEAAGSEQPQRQI